MDWLIDDLQQQPFVPERSFFESSRRHLTKFGVVLPPTRMKGRRVLLDELFDGLDELLDIHLATRIGSLDKEAVTFA